MIKLTKYFILFTAVASLVGCGGYSRSVSQLGGSKDGSAALDSTSTEKKPDPIGTFTPDGSGVIIDQTQATHSGPSQYWHDVNGLGYNNNMTWTYVNGGSVSNYMVWRSGQAAGKYDVQVFIPHNYATTRNALYQVEYFQGNNWTLMATRAVNQFNISDAWVDLGTYDFPAEPAVFLGDNTGEAYSTKRMVGFDAVKFSPIGQTAITLPCFWQTNPSWSSLHLGKSSCTMGGYGCLVTSFASVINWAGVTTDPGTLCKWLNANGGFDGAGDLNTSKPLQYAGGHLSTTSKNWHSTAADLNLIKSQIDAGNPVIVEVHYKQSDSENYQHWVVIVGYTLTNSQISDFTIMNPLNTNGSYTSIKPYIYTSSIARWIYAGFLTGRS